MVISKRRVLIAYYMVKGVSNVSHRRLWGCYRWFNKNVMMLLQCLPPEDRAVVMERMMTEG